MTKVWLRPCMALAISALAASARAGGIEYTVTDLGNNIIPNAINAAGHVTGQDSVTGQAFIYNGSTVTDIGALPGGGGSVGNAINSSDQVAGYANTAGGYEHAFLYTSSGGMQDLGTLGGGNSYAIGINNSGEVVGGSTASSGPTNAFLYTSSGGMTDLGTLTADGYSSAFGINDSSEVVGEAYTASGYEHAFLYTSGGGMQDLGSLIGAYGNSDAIGINNSGEVVGSSASASGSEEAFVYSNGVMTDLNSLVDLSPGWTLQQATGINDAGQIVAEAYNADTDMTEGVILTPLVAAPLPAALPAGLGLLGLIAIVRRRRLAV